MTPLGEIGKSPRRTDTPGMKPAAKRNSSESDDRERRVRRRGRNGLGTRCRRHTAVGSPGRILIGYARCSTEKQDLTAQREILRGHGVVEERIYLDHGLTGTNRSRPGLNSAVAALREGDTLVVPKLDRLARSPPDARAIGDSLAARGVRLSLGGSV
jgi:hypothetical protein